MRDALAERLLAGVMGWTPADTARERPRLQAFASLKYDEYQQFSPGMRFVESLALWLEQFSDLTERMTAYEFVMTRLVFLSQAEMAHFAAIIYPDFIRPLLIEQAARDSDIPTFRIRQALASEAFRKLQGSTLFLGLSDGARIDLFRRSNPELSHEQIFTGYELSDNKVDEIQAWLCSRGHTGAIPAIVLIDDFSGSGESCLRADGIRSSGKVAKFMRRTQESDSWKPLVRFPETKVVVALYVATGQALSSINNGIVAIKNELQAEVRVTSVQFLDSSVRIQPGTTDPMIPLIEKYYDPSVEDEHTEKGGTDLKYGFAGCGLPVILHHNTPNNSIFVLWAERSSSVRPLFPRVSRHRREA